MKNKDDECFGDGVDDFLDEDFDFEGNLALFDKAAVFSQIDSSDRRGNGARTRGNPAEQTPSRYRHDENILEAKPVVYRQIIVPQSGAKEYSTGKTMLNTANNNDGLILIVIQSFWCTAFSFFFFSF